MPRNNALFIRRNSRRINDPSDNAILFDDHVYFLNPIIYFNIAVANVKPICRNALRPVLGPTLRFSVRISYLSRFVADKRYKHAHQAVCR